MKVKGVDLQNTSEQFGLTVDAASIDRQSTYVNQPVGQSGSGDILAMTVSSDAKPLTEYNIEMDIADSSGEDIEQAIKEAAIELHGELFEINGHNIFYSEYGMMCPSCDSHSSGTIHNQLRKAGEERIATLYAVGEICDSPCE